MSAQYAAVSNVPLVKYPSLRVPRLVELPPDIHPLPDSVNVYFVYPFTLEPHVLTFESSRRNTLAAHAARREAYLIAREEEKEQRKRDALHKIAPGFDPQTFLVPTRADNRGMIDSNQDTKSVMDSLVDQLAALETSRSNR
ncbi:hypothetical protein JOM56_004894 [Amanita muscaria]